MRTRWAALATLLAAEAMNVLDATITQVAAPAIHADLGGAASDLQWFGAAYTLPFAVLLITGGRLGDRYGRRRMFLAGVAAFALASLCCALAPGAAVLITARAVQGAAAALVIPQTIGLIKAMFTGPELAAALGWNGPVVGLSAVSGPLVGAALTDVLSWRWAFLVNVPIAVAILAAGRLLREDRAEHRVRLDLQGTVLAVAGVGLVVYPLITSWSWPMATAGLAVLVVFCFHQRARRYPLVEPSLFRNRGFPAALATSTLFFAVMNGLMLVVVLHLRLDQGRGVLATGLTLLPWSGGLAVASWFAGQRLVPRYGSRVAFAGLVLLLSGILAAIAAGDSPWLLVALGIGGLGLGLFTVPFFTVALSRVRPHETGSAAGLLNAVQQLGATLGIALLGTTFLHGHSAARAFWLAAALVVATTVTTALMRDRANVVLGEESR